MFGKALWWSILMAALVPVLAGAQPEGFLRVSGERTVDSQGRDVLLRGMGLGGWMLQEGYMLGIRKDGTQHSIKARITDLIGTEDTEAFYRLWRQNHMTRADVDRLAASGFNSIRLPMHYNLFTLPIEEEPVKGRDTWLTTGFEMTDSLLAWCRANRMYLILDLHAAPGGQGKDANISDYDPGKPSLWESEENRRKTVALWRKLAERYANDPWIGGYDILNEPNWTFEGKDKNGREDVSNQPIWDLYKAITRAIREVDTRHIIIVEGNGWGNNYSGFPVAWDGNLVMSFHKYWNPNTEEAVARFLALRKQYRLPIWLGESGENTNEWFRECVTLVEKHGIGWAWWPYKKVANPRCIQTVTPPDDFTKVVAYWNGEGERPSRETARRALFALVENLKIANCRFNADVAQALIRPSSAPGVEVVASEANRRVDVYIDGLPFTSYIDPTSLKKPVLYPLRTSAGTLVTRGFPLDPRPGERVDHPHQVGLWFNYGDVNGIDFWNNSDAIKPEDRSKMGTIVHRAVASVRSGADAGVLEVDMDWVMPDGGVVLREHTRFVFRGGPGVRSVDRVTTLTAQRQPVAFTDNKEGVLGLRVARALEAPSDKPEVFTDAAGRPTLVASMDNAGVNGVYQTSEGVRGDAVWGTRGRWCLLTGHIGTEPVTLAILDHPDNPGYPTYWHARGYGLFAANPLGQKALSNGKDTLDFSLAPGGSVTFRHRVLVLSEAAAAERVEAACKAFGAEKQ